MALKDPAGNLSDILFKFMHGSGLFQLYIMYVKDYIKKL